MKSAFKQRTYADALLRNYADAENLSPGNWINAFDETSPWLNITEDDEFFYINVFAAGFTKEEFKVSIENNIITISAYQTISKC